MLYRFQIDLAIPEAVFDAIPSTQKQELRNAVRAFKALSVKINPGQLNEELTDTATWHRCYNDTAERLCEPKQDI